MVQKRILMALAVPVAAAIARFAAGKLRTSGKSGIADKIDAAANMVSPQKKRGGMFSR